MKAVNVIGATLGVTAALTLGACGTMSDPQYGATTAPTSEAQVVSADNAYPGYGVVHSIELVEQEPSGIGGTGIGVGTVAGAVVGGVVGSQVGSGSGKTAATLIGAAGGAYVGHQIENRQQESADAYKITIRMNDGSYQALMHSTTGDFRVGDRVRIGNGILQRY